MDVVGHEAVVIEGEAMGAEVLQHQLAVALEVRWLVKHRGAVIAAGEHVVTAVIS